MKNASVLFNEEQLRYLQDTLHVPRKDLIETILLSHISATDIANCVRKRKQKLPARNILTPPAYHVPGMLKIFRPPSTS